MIQKTLISSVAAAALFAAPAFGQTAGKNVIREAIPTQKNVIIANSAEDIAIQEEIRKIRAFNASVDAQVGISETYSYTESAIQTAPIAEKSYQEQRVVLFAPQSAQTTQVTYGTSPAQIVPVSTATPHSTAISRAGIHTIVENDTLYSLSRAQCVTVADIQNANSMSGNNLRLGTKINLPASRCGGASAASVTVPASSTRVTTPATGQETGTVRNVMKVPTSIQLGTPGNYGVLPSDTLYSIGRLNCVSAQQIADHNGIDINAPIQPGQMLRLPLGNCTKK